ncbi:hypothetical protein AB0M36_10280 [Actinoplanes sp. NPDC051346]|uniref:hypothetical protein n=1 Tax=Actinoplanes sp. NPDC051346 TaxID=3155048 RepID=UPI00343FC2FD
MTRPKATALALAAASALAVPATAATAALPNAVAPADPALLEAVTEITDEWPIKVEYRVRRGDVVRAPLGVLSADKNPIRGLVAKVQIGPDLRFTHRYRNCWYTVDGDEEIAWCEFTTALLPAHGGLAITTPVAAVRTDTEPGTVAGVGFRWQSKGWSDARGGLRPVTAFFAGPGEPVVRGDQGMLTLSKSELPVADIRTNGNFISLTVTNEPPLIPNASLSASPSATPSASPSATPSVGSPSASPSASPSLSSATGGAAPTGGEGLPITGAPIVPVAAAGGILLLLGLAARITRRRTRFTA